MLRQNVVQLEKLTFKYEASQNYPSLHSLIFGELNKEYSYCGALKFKDETQGLCYSSAKIKLQKFSAPPETFVISGWIRP